MQRDGKQKERVKARPEVPGHYKRNLGFFYAIEYVAGFSDSPRKTVLLSLLRTALLQNDEEIVQRVLKVHIDDISSHDRDKEWEKCSISVKQERIRNGTHTIQKRYEMEIEEIKNWDGDISFVYTRDLVGVYRSLPQQGRQVGWEVLSTNRVVIHTDTERALDAYAYKILLHQHLYDGLKFSRSSLRDFIKRAMDFPDLAALILHTVSSIKDDEWSQFMLKASSTGLLELVTYMLECGTLPKRDDLEEVVNQMTMRSEDTSQLNIGEQLSQKDKARDVRLRIVSKLEIAGFPDDAHRVREIRVPVGEERLEFDRQKEERKKKLEKKANWENDENLIDMDDEE